MKKVTVIMMAILMLAFMFNTVWASGDQLYPLYPKVVTKDRLATPDNWGVDTEYNIQHCDDAAEYYLGSGALNDTFFIVFEPPAACSVKYVEVQWFDGGNVTAFAAWYSEEAKDAFPEGQAPARGQTPISPIGTWIAGPVPNTAVAEGWTLLDLGGTEFQVGNAVTLESDMFGIGFIKGAAVPHPLADGMDSKGIRFTYTWFGGPWMPDHGYPNIWGAYSSNLLTGTVIELMMRVWVTYPWGMPILISNVVQKCNTYDTAGPYTISCDLVDDDPGITPPADDVHLDYYVMQDTVLLVDTASVTLIETAPGSGVFEADIPGQPVGCTISYWIHTIDDVGLVNSSLPMLFNVLEPYRPDADVLFVDDGTSDRYTCYVWGLDDIGVYASYWDVSGNMGIDNSVINLGWGTIIVAGWGVASVPALTDDTPYRDFLDNGGNLAVIDQDYFYGNNLPATGTFVTGDFAYDYLGLGDFNNDPTPADANYVGAEGDIITDPFVDDYYLTYWDTTGIHMGEASFWADYFTTNLATYNFVGEIDGNTYGCAYDEGTFKTVFLSFMAEANCEIQSFPGGDTWVPTDQFRTLLTGIFNFFGSAGVDNKIELSPVKYSLDQNYPNPFNPTTTINFNLANSGKVTLKVFNMLGQEVASIIEGNMSAGNHTINFDASSLSSGVYYYKLNACDFEATKEMLLVK